MPLAVLQRLASGSRVAIIRLRSLGDCVLTTPAIAILNRFRPDLEIAVVIEDRFAPVFDANPAVASILPASTTSIAHWRPDLALNVHGGATSSQLTFASRARFRAGFEHFRFRALYNVRIPRAQKILGVERKVHTAEHLASAMFYLGAPTSDIPRGQLFARQSPPPGSYAVVHPKASQPDKTWPAEHFEAVAKHLKNDANLESIFIAGPGEDLTDFAAFDCKLGASLEEIKTLVSGAALFIGNDSGPAHMAAAFGVPVVVIFGSSDPVTWAPWKTESQVLAPSPNGSISSIPVSDALAAIERLAIGQPQ